MTTTLDIANKTIIALLLKLIFMYKYHIGYKVFLKSPLKLLFFYNITIYSKICRTGATIIRWAKSRNLLSNSLVEKSEFGFGILSKLPSLQKNLFSHNSEILFHQMTILWYLKRFTRIWPNCCFCFSRRILKQKSATFWITLFSCFSCQKWFRTVTTGGVSKVWGIFDIIQQFALFDQ